MRLKYASKEDVNPTEEIADENKQISEAHKEAHAVEHKKASDALKMRAKMTTSANPT